VKTDPWLGRLERRAVSIAIAASALALVVPGGGVRWAGAVAGGALLIGVSYWSTRQGVTGLTDAVAARAEGAGAPSGPGPIHMKRRMLVVLLRYALLAGMAYVMIARLRLPPMGLLVGASVVAVAAALELGRRADRT